MTDDDDDSVWIETGSYTKLYLVEMELFFPNALYLYFSWILYKRGMTKNGFDIFLHFN